MTLPHIWDMDGFAVPLITRSNVGVGNWLQSTWLVLPVIFYLQRDQLKKIIAFAWPYLLGLLNGCRSILER